MQKKHGGYNFQQEHGTLSFHTLSTRCGAQTTGMQYKRLTANKVEADTHTDLEEDILDFRIFRIAGPPRRRASLLLLASAVLYMRSYSFYVWRQS